MRTHRRSGSASWCLPVAVLVAATTCGLSVSAAADEGCDTTRRPIVFVHGGWAAGDGFATQVQRFVSNGTCADRLFVFDYDTMSPRLPEDELEGFIRSALAQSGATQVSLLAHSYGGAVSYAFLADPARRALVASYAHLASFPAAAPPGPPGDPVPTLNVYSDGDHALFAGPIPGAENLMISSLDHLQVGFGPQTFAAVYAFFNDGEEPVTTEVTPEPVIELAGRAITFGENHALAGARVRIYAVDPRTGQRASAAPAAELWTAGDGAWGPFIAAAGAYYELELEAPTAREGLIHHYREPFVRSDRLVYLRAFRSVTQLKPLRQMPADDASAVHINLSYGHAVVSGRDRLTVNGVDAAFPELAAPDATMAMTFFWDDDGNGFSDRTPIQTFIKFGYILLRGMDLFLPPGGTAAVNLDGRLLRAPAVPSNRGYTITIFN